jgi:Rrf2 family protein
MLALAFRYGSGPLMVKDIAEQQSLPATYLEQLMVLLRKSGLVTATRGAHGGYVLTRPPMDITLAEIIEALEGPLDLVECATEGVCNVPRETCALVDVWEEASNALVQVFKNITLANLVERQRTKESSSVLMYSI